LVNTASYIRLEDNVEADWKLRIKNIDTEWKLADHVFHRAEKIFGHPVVDLFAIRYNTQCIKFFT